MDWNLTVLSARWRTHSRTFNSGQFPLSNSVVLLSRHQSEIFPLQRVSQHVSWCFKDTLKRSLLIFLSFGLGFLSLISAAMWDVHWRVSPKLLLLSKTISHRSGGFFRIADITWKYVYFLFLSIHIYLFIIKAIKSLKYSLSHAFKLCSNTLIVD